MADSNLLKRFLDAGAAFTQLTQARAEAIVKDLVSAGEVQTSQTQATVAELIERSRENTERLLDQVRTDFRSQVKNMGLATKDDIARLEGRIASLSAAQTAAQAAAVRTAAEKTSAPAAAATQASKRTAAKSAAKRTPTKSTTKSAAKRTPTKAAAKKR